MNTKNPKGTVIGYVLVAMIILLAFGGIAVDLAALFTARTELHRTTDAAALAGAGKLGFNDSVFPAVRDAAVLYANNNPTRFGTVTLDPNDANDATGDIVLGVWDGSARTFTPSLDGTVVNAVQCRASQVVPTWWIRVLGLTSLNMSAESIAISPAPSSPPAEYCPFPIGVCSPGGGSVPCGQAKLIFQQPAVNTAGWIKGLCGNNVKQAIQAAAGPSGACPCPGGAAGGSTGDMDPVQNGQNNGAFKEIADCTGHSACRGDFVDQYNASSVITICSKPASDGSCAPESVVYNGKGWLIHVPIIKCDPGQPINQPHEIVSYARYIVTQVLSYDRCAVTNTWPGPWTTACQTPPGNKWIMYGYFDCGNWDAGPSPVPDASRIALGDRLRLAQ